jgi:hypothetical protein
VIRHGSLRRVRMMLLPRSRTAAGFRPMAGIMQKGSTTHLRAVISSGRSAFRRSRIDEGRKENVRTRALSCIEMIAAQLACRAEKLPWSFLLEGGTRREPFHRPEFLANTQKFGRSMHSAGEAFRQAFSMGPGEAVDSAIRPKPNRALKRGCEAVGSRRKGGGIELDSVGSLTSRNVTSGQRHKYHCSHI